MNTDFLSIDPDDVKFKNISHFLVDPSCCEWSFNPILLT